MAKNTPPKDDKPASETEPTKRDVFDLRSLSNEELVEMLADGRIIPPKQRKFNIDESFNLANLEKFILGEITWAQLQGVTAEQAQAIAEQGYSLYKEGRYHDARIVFEGLIICNPVEAYFHSMLGAVLQQLDHFRQCLRCGAAVECYSNAINYDPNHINSYLNRGELYLLAGKFKAAFEDLKRVVELDPQGQQHAGARARALMDATAKAIMELQKQKKPGNQDR